MANVQNLQGTFSVFRSHNTSNSNYLTQDFNEAISFCGISKSYLDVVYNSPIRWTLFLSIDELTSDSDKSRLAIKNKKIVENKRRGTVRIPRPQNSFIIYRRDKRAMFIAKKESIASKNISVMWNNEPDEVKEYYIALSLLAKDNHTEKYGEYKYQPRKRSVRTKPAKKTPVTPQSPSPPSPPSPQSSPQSQSQSQSSSFNESPNDLITELMMNADIDDDIDDFINFDFDLMSEEGTIHQAPPPINEYPTPTTTSSSSIEDFSLTTKNFLMEAITQPSQSNIMGTADFILYPFDTDNQLDEQQQLLIDNQLFQTPMTLNQNTPLQDGFYDQIEWWLIDQDFSHDNNDINNFSTINQRPSLQ